MVNCFVSAATDEIEALARLSILSAAMLVMLVGFSRIALGAHYLSDVIAAFFLGFFG